MKVIFDEDGKFQNYISADGHHADSIMTLARCSLNLQFTYLFSIHVFFTSLTTVSSNFKEYKSLLDHILAYLHHDDSIMT